MRRKVSVEYFAPTMREYLPATDKLILMMRNVQYGYYTHTGELRWQIMDQPFWDDYRFLSPAEMLKLNLGICWSRAELMRDVFNEYRMDFNIVYVELDKDNTHTFAVFMHNQEFYWFEHSFDPHRGVHGPFKSVEEAVLWVVRCIWNYDGIQAQVDYATIYDRPPFDLKAREFMEFCRKGRPLNLEPYREKVMDKPFSTRPDIIETDPSKYNPVEPRG